MLSAIVLYLEIDRYINRRPRVPLSDEEKKRITQYGVITFTKKENVESILGNGIFAGKKHMLGERGLSWYCFCSKNTSKSIDEAWPAVQKTRPNCDVCIHLHDISAESVNLFSKNKKGHLAYRHPKINKKVYQPLKVNMTLYNFLDKK